MKVWLKDNSEKTFPKGDVLDLLPIANKSINQLCKENEHLLIFPYSLADTADRIGESAIMSAYQESSENVKVSTGNILGFIGKGKLKLTIKSRFDEGRDDYMMHYMLQKVLSFNLLDLNHNNEQETIFDFLMLMFPVFLRNALRQGIYREYKTYRCNDNNVRGAIDINRHIRDNIPFTGNIAYTYRDFSRDNDVTELIRHTIEFMRTRDYGRAALSIDSETTSNIKTVTDCTPTYNKNARSYIIGRNLRNRIHPFYTAYAPLQSLCLQILRMDEVRYGNLGNELCGILFDGAWLWEEYLNTVLSPLGFRHPRNKKGTGRITLFEDGSGPRFPDFYQNNVVLDAKYKKLRSYDNVSLVDRDDLHQIITYINCLNSSLGGFIVPLNSRQPVVPSKKLRGCNASVCIFGIEISNRASSYTAFCERMKDAENNLVKDLLSAVQ